MANVQKFTRSNLTSGSLIRHFERDKDEYGNYHKWGNEEIDPSRSHLNYNLALEHEQGQADFIKRRLSQVKCLAREDVNVLCSWIVTAPAGLATGTEVRANGRERYTFEGDKTKAELQAFFKHCYDFLAQKYGEKNVVSAYVHMDETTPHIHFAFVPVVVDKKKGHEKVSAKEALGWSERGLHRFHGELDEYMTKAFGRDIGIVNEATKDGNKEIWELKTETIAAEERARYENALADERAKYEIALAEERVRYKTTLTEEKSKNETAVTKEKAEHEAALTELQSELQSKLEATIRPIEGKVAHEKYINAMMDGIKESKNPITGKVKTTITLEGSKGHVIAVINAAKDRDKMRVRRDVAVEECKDALTERDTAINERNTAVKERSLMERRFNTAMANVTHREQVVGDKEKAVAEAEKQAAEKQAQANALYHQQQHLNLLYQQAVQESSNYKKRLEAEGQKVTALANEKATLQNQLRVSQENLRNTVQAVATLKYGSRDNGLGEYKAPLTPKQAQLIDAIVNRSAKSFRSVDRGDLAEDAVKYIGISKDIEVEIKALEPKRTIRLER